MVYISNYAVVAGGTGILDYQKMFAWYHDIKKSNHEKWLEHKMVTFPISTCRPSSSSLSNAFHFFSTRKGKVVRRWERFRQHA